MKLLRNYFYLFLLITSLASCKKDDDKAETTESYKGFVYTSTNSSTANAIVAMGRKSDGTLAEISGSPYMTGNAGDASEGDFDTQSGLRIIGDYLLSVNAGANPVNGSISVFKLNRTDGTLTQIDQNSSTPAMDNMDSHGERAVSITTKDLSGTTWVVVGNQFANPNFQKTPAVAFGDIMSTPSRNLVVFTFNKTTGILEFKSIGATYTDGNNGGPSDVEFNSAGTKLAVSTWGVPHFDTPEPDLTKQKSSRLYIYNFSAGTLTQSGMFEETGISGSIGLSWSPNDQYVYLSNFNLHSSKEDNGITVHDGTTAAKVQNFNTGGRNDESCWTWVSLDKTKLYVASFHENVVSVFDIMSDGKIAKTLNPNFVTRAGMIPPGDTKDIYQTPDGYLYVSGAFQTHTIAVFKMASNGAIAEMTGSPYPVPSAGKSKDIQAFIGLTGFEK